MIKPQGQNKFSTSPLKCGTVLGKERKPLFCNSMSYEIRQKNNYPLQSAAAGGLIKRIKMIKVENVDVYGFEHAVRGMRNPMNSWSKSDSDWEQGNWCDAKFIVGEDDLNLMHRLYVAGTEHRTYARMIYVWMDVTAPLYWWKEMDRYGIGKSQVSTSTMHKIHAKEFTFDDFSVEHLYPTSLKDFERIIDDLNYWRKRHIENKSKRSWWQMIQLLPSSYNQMRTICMSYEVVFKIIKERTGHKLDDWNAFVEVLKSLPHINEIIGESE